MLINSSDVIKALRLRSNLSQNCLSLLSGVAQSSVSKYESRKVVPTFETVVALIQSAGYEFFEFMNWFGKEFKYD